MKLIIGSHRLKLTDSLKNYSHKKLLTPLQKIVKSPGTRLTVKLSNVDSPKNKMNKKCHIILSAPRLKPVNISIYDRNMYAAIDRAHHSVIRQVKRQRERITGPLRRAS